MSQNICFGRLSLKDRLLDFLTCWEKIEASRLRKKHFSHFLAGQGNLGPYGKVLIKLVLSLLSLSLSLFHTSGTNSLSNTHISHSHPPPTHFTLSHPHHAHTFNTLSYTHTHTITRSLLLSPTHSHSSHPSFVEKKSISTF